MVNDFASRITQPDLFFSTSVSENWAWYSDREKVWCYAKYTQPQVFEELVVTVGCIKFIVGRGFLTPLIYEGPLYGYGIPAM